MAMEKVPSVRASAASAVHSAPRIVSGASPVMTSNQYQPPSPKAVSGRSKRETPSLVTVTMSWRWIAPRALER